MAHPLDQMIEDLPEGFHVEDFTLQAVRRVMRDGYPEPCEFRYVMTATGMYVYRRFLGQDPSHHILVARFDPRRTGNMGLYVPMPGDHLDVWWRDRNLTNYPPIMDTPYMGGFGTEWTYKIENARILYHFRDGEPFNAEWLWT